MVVVVVSWFVAFPMIVFSINLSKIRLSLQSKHISTEWIRDRVPMFAAHSATFSPAIQMYLALKPHNFIDSISSDWRNGTSGTRCSAHAIPTILYQRLISSIFNVNTIKWLYFVALANATRDRDIARHTHTPSARHFSLVAFHHYPSTSSSSIDEASLDAFTLRPLLRNTKF